MQPSLARKHAGRPEHPSHGCQAHRAALSTAAALEQRARTFGSPVRVQGVDVAVWQCRGFELGRRDTPDVRQACSAGAHPRGRREGLCCNRRARRAPGVEHRLALRVAARFEAALCCIADCQQPVCAVRVKAPSVALLERAAC